MDLDLAKRRIRFRAWHRGTKEADIMIGGFADRYLDGWGAEEIAWFEALLDETDVDIMSWAMRREPPPERYRGPLMDALQRLDFIRIAR